MAVKLNRAALAHARSLVEAWTVVRDDRDDWSQHAPSTKEQNDFIEKRGWEEYGKWHLGIDRDKAPGTKGRFSFPFGDFTDVHRCAVISLESRAAQHDHDDIFAATKVLLQLIDR
jgi:hypothetical protein